MSTEPDTDDSRGWDAARRRVLDRDGHACRFCGIDDDHRDEFVDGHPTFAREFGVGVREDGIVVASEFDRVVSASGSPRLGAEWDFAVAWGYKKALDDGDR